MLFIYWFCGGGCLFISISLPASSSSFLIQHSSMQYLLRKYTFSIFDVTGDVYISGVKGFSKSCSRIYRPDHWIIASLPNGINKTVVEVRLVSSRQTHIPSTIAETANSAACLAFDVYVINVSKIESNKNTSLVQ